MALNSPNTMPANSTPTPSAIQRWRGVYGTGGGCSQSQPIMKMRLNDAAEGGQRQHVHAVDERDLAEHVGQRERHRRDDAGAELGQPA